MNLLIKNITLNIDKSYFQNSNYSIDEFYTFKLIRNNIISEILSENLYFQNFEILLIISKENNICIELKVTINNTKILKFTTQSDAISFYLYIKNDTYLSDNYSIYFLDNNYYFIFDRLDLSSLKLIDFECMSYSPLILARIVENGLKITT